MVSHAGSLSNIQLELLKAFSHNLEEKDLQELRKRLAQFFADRLVNQADKVWDSQGWSNEKIDDFLNSKGNIK